MSPVDLGDFSAWGMIAALFGAALAAGFVDSIAGGGGLLTVPALFWAGLPPAQALATNKLQASFGSLSASVHFIRAGIVSPGHIVPAILATAVGAGAGAVAIQHLDPAVLRAIVPFLLLGAAVFLLCSPKLGTAARPPRLPPVPYAVLIAPVLGFYDGFFGPGTGSFMVIAQVTLLGLELTRATARTKVLNFTSNAASLVFFLFGGQIQWTVGLAMALGQTIGARLGSKLVIRTDAQVVRPLLVLISVALSLKLLFVGDSAPLHWIFTP
jgi:uncharacterized membrane protein YfcA